jgi:hypothetical protein
MDLHRRYVIRAAHCPPCWPESDGTVPYFERTYQALLGPLGGEQTVSAECVLTSFVLGLKSA